ncbi:MAG: hypothetical protein IJP45_03025 [Paludibacteraceae bacterium]|nr:hypothetical protein [Paludibacteraceae bacterium]
MKRLFLSAIIIASIITLSSCHSGSEADLPPDNDVTLIKFKDPSYVNNLIVNDYSTGFFLMRGNRCNAGYLKNTYGKDWNYSFEPLDERTPYIELIDGWYLIDWSWNCYPYNGQTLLTEVTWDNYKGEYFFDKSTPHISGNIFEKRGVNFMDLVAYTYPNGNYPLFTFHYPNSSYVEEVNEYLYFSYLIGGPYAGPHIDFLSGNGDCLCNRVEEMDALWDLIRSQLITLIQNGDLYSLPRATEEQRLEILHEIIKLE